MRSIKIIPYIRFLIELVIETPLLFEAGGLFKKECMKKKNVYECLGITAVIYLAGAVASASLRIPEWDSFVRAVVSIGWLLALWIYIGVVTDRLN